MKIKKENKEDIHRRRRTLLVLAAVFLLAMGVCLTLPAYRPATYQPGTPKDPGVVSPYLTHKLGPDFYNQVQLDEPFELVVDQAGLNDIFSRVPWPVQMDEVGFSMPTVLFDKGQITLMGQVNYKGLNAVASILMTPVLDEKGWLHVNIQAVRLGALPITPLARAIARRLTDEYLPEASSLQTEPAMKIADAILNNQPLELVFPIDQYTVRLKRLSIEPGQAKLLLVPVAP